MSKFDLVQAILANHPLRVPTTAKPYVSTFRQSRKQRVSAGETLGSEPLVKGTVTGAFE